MNIVDTPLIPPTPNRGPSFDERLHLATDGKIHEMIDLENEDFIHRVNSGYQFPKKDFNAKDMDLIQKMNVIA